MPLQTGGIQIGFRITVSVGESMLGGLNLLKAAEMILTDFIFAAFDL